jgi:hypothetical protein
MIAAKINGLFQIWKNLRALPEKRRRLTDMLERVREMKQLPGWLDVETFLSAQIEASLQEMLQAKDERDFRYWAGIRDGLVKALEFEKHIEKGLTLVNSISKGEN